MKKVIICGPESTGKTTLARELARHYNTIWVPEYARDYISNLKHQYSFNDIAHIARVQTRQLIEKEGINNNLVIFDTSLIITKVWFKEVYQEYPKWIDKAIEKYKPHLYLLCYYDLPWEFDPLRENGSVYRRGYLFNKYLSEIEKTGSEIKIIKGFKKERLNLAIETIDSKIFNDGKN